MLKSGILLILLVFSLYVHKGCATFWMLKATPSDVRCRIAAFFQETYDMPTKFGGNCSNLIPESNYTDQQLETIVPILVINNTNAEIPDNIESPSGLFAQVNIVVNLGKVNANLSTIEMHSILPLSKTEDVDTFQTVSLSNLTNDKYSQSFFSMKPVTGNSSSTSSNSTTGSLHPSYSTNFISYNFSSSASSNTNSNELNGQQSNEMNIVGDQIDASSPSQASSTSNNNASQLPSISSSSSFSQSNERNGVIDANELSSIPQTNLSAQQASISSSGLSLSENGNATNNAIDNIGNTGVNSQLASENNNVSSTNSNVALNGQAVSVNFNSQKNQSNNIPLTTITSSSTSSSSSSNGVPGSDSSPSSTVTIIKVLTKLLQTMKTMNAKQNGLSEISNIRDGNPDISNCQSFNQLHGILSETLSNQQSGSSLNPSNELIDRLNGVLQSSQPISNIGSTVVDSTPNLVSLNINTIASTSAKQQNSLGSSSNTSDQHATTKENSNAEPDKVSLSVACQYKGQTFPHPKDCTVFYFCGSKGVNRLKCPDPLLFDIQLKKCNWPDKVTCLTQSQSTFNFTSNTSSNWNSQTSQSSESTQSSQSSQNSQSSQFINSSISNPNSQKPANNSNVTSNQINGISSASLTSISSNTGQTSSSSGNQYTGNVNVNPSISGLPSYNYRPIVPIISGNGGSTSSLSSSQTTSNGMINGGANSISGIGHINGGGVSSGGLSSNGISSNGVSTNGISSSGLNLAISNGMINAGANSISGIGHINGGGVSSGSLSPSGISSNGVSTIGISSSGLNAGSSCRVGDMWRDPNDCAVFYVCTTNSIERFACTAPLYYDSKLKICQYPHLVSCTVSSSSHTSSQSSSASLTGIGSVGSIGTSNGGLSAGVISSGTSNSIPSSGLSVGIVSGQPGNVGSTSFGSNIGASSGISNSNVGQSSNPYSVCAYVLNLLQRNNPQLLASYLQSMRVQNEANLPQYTLTRPAYTITQAPYPPRQYAYRPPTYGIVHNDAPILDEINHPPYLRQY